MRFDSQRGFTLVETIIYLAVIGTVVVAMISFALDLLNIRTETHTVSEVGHNAFVIQERLTEAARHAEGVNTGNSTFDTDPGVLELDMIETARDPMVFELDQNDGTLQVTEGSGGGGGGGSTSGSYVDDTQGEFDQGTYSNTQWNTDHVELSSGQTSGTYSSQIFDSGDTATQWDQLSWAENLPGGGGLKMEVGTTTIGSSAPTPGQIIDDTQSEFDTGTYSDTQWSTDHVELTGTGQTNGVGTYTSEVFDIGNTTDFTDLSWTPDAPYGKPLPDNAATETAYSTGNVDMSNNVMLLHSDEPAGSTTFSDTSGQNNDATCSGTQCPTAGVSGRYNAGLDFDGTEDRISIASNSDLEISNNLTASAWVNIDQLTSPDHNPILWKGSQIGWGANYMFRMAVKGGGTMTWGVTYGGTEDWFEAGSITFNEWNHVALTYDGSTARAYINGVEVGTNGGGGSSLNTFPSEPVRSGFAYRETPTQETYLDGTVDEYGIWDRTMSQGEIQDMYERGMMRIEYQLRSCDDVACSGETFTGPDGTSGDVYSEEDNASTGLPSFSITNQPDEQYFQYQSTLETDDSSLNPELQDVTIDYEEQVSGLNFATVNLQENYTNPVVVPLYFEDNNTAAFSPRLRNVTSNSFEVALQSPGGTVSSGDDVHYLVVEEGVHTMPDGTLIEAGEVDTSVVSSSNNGWSGVNESFSNSYGSPPAVFHQVQSYNDTGWIESWVSRQGDRNNPPDTSGFQISLNGAEVTDSHGTETIGWVAIEQGAGTVDGQDFEVSVTSDSIRGHGNGCDTFNYTNSYISNPIVIADQEEMDGGDGGWVVGCSQSTSALGLHVEEDQVNDSERNHTTETGAFAAFAGAFNIAPTVVDVTFQVRSCDDTSCAGESFVGPDGTGGTQFTNPTGETINVSTNRYFQYRATLTSSSTSNTPELSSVTVDYTIPGSGGSGTSVNITSDDIAVTNLVFRNLTSTEDVGIIQVEFTLTATGPTGNPLYQYEETYQTTLRIPFDN